MDAFIAKLEGCRPLKKILGLFYWRFFFLWPNLISKFKVREQRNLIYKNTSAGDLTLDLYLPEILGLRPAVIVVHGGAWFSRRGYMTTVSQYLAHSGFVVANITYRLSPQPNYNEATEDVSDAIAWVKKNAKKYSIDVDNLFGWGYSAGAHLILLAGLDSQAGLKAIVAGGTPADFTRSKKSEYIINFLGCTYEQNPELWQKMSVVNLVQKNSPPVFLYHGGDDELVAPAHTENLEKKLIEKNVPHEVFLIPKLGHVTGYLFSPESLKAGTAFLKKYAKRNLSVPAKN
jgi:acetyl esterase/lipase